MADPTVSFSGDATSLLKAYADLDAARKKELATIADTKRANAEAAREEAALAKEVAKIRQSQVTPIQQYQKEIDKLKNLLTQQLISEKEFTVEQQKQLALFRERKAATPENRAKAALEAAAATERERQAKERLLASEKALAEEKKREAAAQKEIDASNAAALKRLEKAEADALARKKELGNAGQRAWEQTRTPLEKYNAEVSRLSMLLKNKVITQDTFNRSIEQQKQIFEQTIPVADGMGSKLAGMGKDALVSITGIGSTMAGVAAVFSTIKAEYEELKARDERARQAQLSFGDVMRDLSTGFTPDATLGRGDLQGAVTQIMKQSGAGGSTAALALSDALAGRGSLPASSAVGMASAAATINPGNIEDTREMAFRGMQMMDALGLQDPKQALGLLAQVKNVATVAKMRDVGQTAVPSILSLQTYGDTPEQSAELFSTVNNLLKDKEGSRSRTAIEQLSLQLAEYLPQMGSTTERLAAVMGDPKAHGKFINDANFDSAAKAQMRELLSGAAAPRALMATARAGITSPQMSVGAYDTMVAESLAIDAVRLSDVNRRTDANRELRLIADAAGGQSGQSAATIDKDMETIGYRAPQWMTRMASGLTRFAGRVAGASPDAIDNASAIIAPVAVEAAFQAAVFGGGSSSAVDRETLRYQQEQLQELRRVNRGGPPENALGRQPAGK